MCRVLLLPGYACKSWIWSEVKQGLGTLCQLDTLDWPTDITLGFHNPDAFACWVRDSVLDRKGPYDLIVGHSMGGLVALKAAALAPGQVKQVIVIESFLVSPGPFFQNLLLADTPAEIAEKVTEMLKLEQQHYSERLRNQLIELDLTDLVISLDCEVAALYGDRGCRSSEEVLANLQWSADLQAKVSMYIIHDSCHFPMLENPQQVMDVLRCLLV